MANNSVKIGPAGWNYRDWKGIFYPSRQRGLSELAFLSEYFDTAEINSSFYGPISPQSAAKWLNEVKGNGSFVFTAKLWQRFTHEAAGNMRDEKAVREGFDVLQNAGKLGAVLLQFPFSFHHSKDNVELLAKLIARFHDYPLVLEVRHASWDTPEIYEWLAERKVGFCNIDQPIIGRSLKPTSHVTSSVGYVRLHGRRQDTWFSSDPKLPPSVRYDYLYLKDEILEWAERIKLVKEKSKTMFVITNNHPAAKSLHAALTLVSALTGIKPNAPESMVEAYPDLGEIVTSKKDTLF